MQEFTFLERYRNEDREAVEELKIFWDDSRAAAQLHTSEFLPSVIQKWKVADRFVFARSFRLRHDLILIK
jgi:predicted membrane protein